MPRWSRLSSGSKGFLTILSGTAGAQFLLLISAPIISRLFPPDQFGPFAVINSLVLPVATVMALRYELAIALPERAEDARALLALGLRICLVVTIAFLVLVVLFLSHLADITGLNRGQASLLVWVPVIGGTIGWYVLLNQMAIRIKAYGSIARRNLLQAGTVVSLQILAGAMGAGPHGLAAGLFLGQMAGVLTLMRDLRPEIRWVSTAHLWSVAGQFKRFPFIMAPSGFINSLGLQAPIILSSLVYGATVAGWFGMTQRVLALPVTLVGKSMAQVYLGEFGALRRKGSDGLMAVFLQTSRRLFLAGMVGAVILFLAAPLLFRTLLGSEWEESGRYAMALAPALAAQLVAAPLSQTLIVMGRVGWQAIWDVARLVLCGGVFLVAPIVDIDAFSAIVWFSSAMTISYVALWLLSYFSLRSGLDNEAIYRS